MRGFSSVYKKELYSMFASPIFYVVAFTFLVISGYFFYSILVTYTLISFQAGQNPMWLKQLSITNMVVNPFFLNVSVVLLLLSPLLTMRLYAEERKLGTLELLFTYPIADRASVLAKFAAVVTSLVVILAGTIPSILVLGYIGDPNWKPILSAYLGILLLGSSFLALGLFTSSLTQSQIVAAVLSFGALLMFWVIGWARNFVGPAAGGLIEYLSIMNHFEGFTKGVLDSRDLIYYVLFMAFFLFLTLRRIEYHRWRA